MIKLNESLNYYKRRSKAIGYQEQKWSIEKENLERENTINKEYQSLLKQSKIKRLTTSKFMLALLFINCTIIEIFTAIVTIESLSIAKSTGLAPDFTPLVALITAVVGEVIGLVSYLIKASKQNTKGGITYETAAAANFKQSDSEGVG